MRTVVAVVASPAGMAWLGTCALEAALVLAASWLGAALVRRGSAAARHQMWTLGVVGAVVLPLLCAVVPALAPASLTATIAARTLAAPAMLVVAGPTDAAATWPAWLAIAWAVAALVVALRLSRGHLAAHRIARAAVPAAVVDGLQLYRSATIGSPMTIGVLRPRVVLPAAADAWSPARLRAVVVHELGHVRRRDNLVQLVAQLACALYWWNPLAWLAAARLRVEREHACDDLVLDAGILPSSYAADLLDVARAIAGHAHTGATCMVDRSWTEARLRRILDASTPRRPLRARVRIAAWALALTGTATLACTSAKPVLPPAPVAAPAPLGTLAVGMPFVRHVDGFRSPSDDLAVVTTEVKRRLGDLQACYERRLAITPTLSGTVVIHWTLADTGEVTDTCVTEDTVGDDGVTACVNELVHADRFPVARGGAIDVSFPFVFTAREKPFTMLLTGG